MIRKIFCLIALTSAGLAWAGKNDALQPLSAEEQKTYDGFIVRRTMNSQSLSEAENSLWADLAPREEHDVFNGEAPLRVPVIGVPLTPEEYSTLYMCNIQRFACGGRLDERLEGTLIRLSQRLVANYRNNATLYILNVRPLARQEEQVFYKLLSERASRTLSDEDEVRLVNFTERMLLNLEHARSLRLPALVGTVWGFVTKHAGYIRDGFRGGDAGSSAQ